MNKRIQSIDFIRAVAIILMTITHVNALFSSSSYKIFDIFTYLGATICFSLFLFCSSYLTGTQLTEGKNSSLKKLCKRTLLIYLTYIVLSSIYMLVRNIPISETLNIFTFQTLPEYVDFLPSFVFFMLIAYIFFKPLQKLQQKPLLLICISILLFFAGNYLSTLQTNIPILQYLKIHFVGDTNIHSFPIFQYFPVFAIGILAPTYNTNRNIITSIAILIPTTLLTILLNLSVWNRWPPSLLFILYGILAIVILLPIAKHFENTKLHKILSESGKYPLQQLTITTSILFLLSTTLQKPQIPTYILILNIVLIAIILIYPTLHNAIIKNEKEG